MKKIHSLAPTLLSLLLLATPGLSQTLVPKWTNSTVFGANQQYVNGGAYNPTTGNLIVCQSSPDIINVCSPVDGHSISTLNVTGLTGPTYAVCGLGVDSAGNIYSSSYGAVASANKINKWTSESAAPTQLISTTLGAGSVGKTMGLYGSGNNAVFILSSTSTSAVYVYWNGSAWAAKALTVVSGTVQGGITIVSWSPTSCSFITKNSGGNGNYNTFNPSAASPITVSQTNYTSVPMAFVSLTATTTPTQGASGYDPATGLFAFHTRALTASPFTISNYLVATIGGHGLSAPAGCTPVISSVSAATSGVDAANYGADFWGNRVLYSAPCTAATGYGFRAFDISAYIMTDISPTPQTKNIGDSATFSVVAGGSGTLTYVWKRNGVTINDGGDFSNATTAALTINPVAAADAGTYTCTVTGAGNISSTSGNGVLNVNLPATSASVALTSGSDPSTYGDSLDFTATITGGGVTPTGQVIFKDGATPIYTNSLSGSGSTATADFPTTTLAAGGRSITAVYGGDGNYSGSTSSPLAQTVNQASLSITANNDSKTYGQTRTYGAGSTAFTSGALQNGETIGMVTLACSGGAANASVSGSPYTITPSAATGGTFNPANYSITYNGGALTVNPLAVVLTGSRNYDGTAIAVASILSVANPVGSDVVTVGGTSATLAGSAVGSEAITSVTGLTLGGGAAGNYTLMGGTGSVTINAAAAITITSESIDSTGTQFTMTWSSTPSVTYHVTGTSDATVPRSSWTTVPGTTVTASGSSTTVTFTIPTSPTTLKYFSVVSP